MRNVQFHEDGSLSYDTSYAFSRQERKLEFQERVLWATTAEKRAEIQAHLDKHGWRKSSYGYNPWYVHPKAPKSWRF